MHSVMTIPFEQAETVRAARALLEVVPRYSNTCVNKYTQMLADNLTTSALAQSKGLSPTWSLSHTQLVPDHVAFHTCLCHHMLVKTAGSSGKCQKHCHTLDVSEAMNVINFYLKHIGNTVSTCCILTSVWINLHTVHITHIHQVPPHTGPPTRATRTEHSPGSN